MSLLSDPDPPLRGKANEMLRACRTGAIRQLQYCYRYFDITPDSAPITYPSSAFPKSHAHPSAPTSSPPTRNSSRSRSRSRSPYRGPPSTISLLATAVAHRQPIILSDLLQTFPSAAVAPELLELCIAEGNVACLDLLLMHDKRAIDTCVATFEGDRVGASLLACTVQADVEMALCLLHHGASVGAGAGTYGGKTLVRLAMRTGKTEQVPGQEAEGGRAGKGKPEAREDDGGDTSDEEKMVNGVEEEPDIELVRELIRRGATVEGALEEAVELGPDFVAAVLGGKPRPSAREIREALGRAKRAELVILKEKMESKKRASMESMPDGIVGNVAAT